MDPNSRYTQYSTHLHLMFNLSYQLSIIPPLPTDDNALKVPTTEEGKYIYDLSPVSPTKVGLATGDGEEIRRISQSEHTSQTKFFPIRKHSSKRPPARQLISCDLVVVQVRSPRSVLCSLCNMLKVLRKHENLIVASQPFNWCSANASNICWSVRGDYVL